jgi:signal transduction histidine kinase
VYCSGKLFCRDITSRLLTIVDNTFRLRDGKSLRDKISGDDEIAHLDSVFHQMSDQIKATELKRLELEALKRDFANMVSHDMRAPLSANRLFLENAADGIYGELNEKGHHAAEHLVTSLDRLLAMLTEMLDVQKLEDATVVLDLRRESAAKILETALAAFRLLAQENKVRVESATPQDGLFIWADAARVGQVLQNLLSNALAYSAPESLIEVSCQPLKDCLEFRVSDQGPGIAESEQQIIFDRFRQAEGGTRNSEKSQGFGLGLAICKAIVEQHRGEIGVISKQGKGSTFWFRIPNSADAFRSAAAADTSLIATVGEASHGGTEADSKSAPRNDNPSG